MREQKSSPLSANQNSPTDGFRCAPSVTPQPHTNPDQRLTVKELAALLNIGVSTTWKMVGDGRLPKPERWGSRCSRWRYGDLFPRKQS